MIIEGGPAPEREPAFAADKSLRRCSAAGLAIRRELWMKAPALWEDIRAAALRGIVVVPGRYDLPSLVLRDLELPDMVVPAQLLDSPLLGGAALVVIGCPGLGIDNERISALDAFVDGGGTLLASGHAGSLIRQLAPDLSLIPGSDRSSSRQQVDAEIQELADLEVGGEWDMHPGGQPISIQATDLIQTLLTARGDRKGSSHPLATRISKGYGSIIQLGSHLLETRPKPDRHGLPASLDPYWVELVQGSEAADHLLGGLTSQSLHRTARAMRFFLWALTQGAAR